MKKQVKISVIIPVYNAENYLVQCLESVMNQTLKDIEIICVDDGSTDSSIQILQEYEKKDDRITVLYQKNQFAGVARNNGLSIAKGKYVAFLDSDDYYALDGLERLYEMAVANDLDFLKAASYIVDTQTDEISTNKYYSNGSFNENQKKNILTFSSAPRKLLSVADVPWNAVYKLDFLNNHNIRFNNLRCINDHSFYIDCLVHASRIMICDIFLTYYRINQSSSLIGVRSKNFNCQLSSYNLVKKIVENIQYDLKKLVLQNELYLIFMWYEKFQNSNKLSMPLIDMVDDFVKTYDSKDVTNDHLSRFDYSYTFNYFLNRKNYKEDTPAVDCPKISFIVPAYNASAYITECIESILNQTLSEIEIICVDDGSTDATPEIIEEYAKYDKRITLLRQQNSYAGTARNKGIGVARGEYISFVDSDDKIDLDFGQKMYDEATRTNADVIASPLKAWYGKKSFTKMSFWLVEKYLPSNLPFNYKDIPQHILTFTPGGPGGKFFNRKFIIDNDIKFLQIKRSEDFYFILYSIAVAERISVIKEPLYYYRQNNASSLESTKDNTPTLFWEANMLFKQKISALEHFDVIKQSYINNTLNRVAFNFNAVNSASGFSQIFEEIKKVWHEELELDQHPREYFYDKNNYDYLVKLMEYDTCLDYLFALSRIKPASTKSQPVQISKPTNTSVVKVEPKKENTFKKIILWIPRKIRGGCRCLKENGFKFTCNRILVHLHIKKDPYK